MPLNPSAPTTIVAFDRVPEFAKGLVRDLRIRWALEEIERPYKVELFGTTPLPMHYREWQPFGQVPAFDDGTVRLFESGAILLYLGEQDERLLPRDLAHRWQATSWLIAALNSVEPQLNQLVNLDIFNAGQEWTSHARPRAVELAELRLKSLSDALGDKEWLAGSFSVADIVMVTVLRFLRHCDVLSAFPKLTDYKARGEARPAFQRALNDQMAGFVELESEEN